MTSLTFDPGSALLILFGISFFLMFFRMPIFVCLGMGCLAFMFISGKIPPAVFGRGVINGLSNQALVAIAEYFLLGAILNNTGLTERLVNFIKSIIGHIPGALSHINVLASVVFAGVSGSSLADTASVGSLMIPMMKKEGYPPGYAAAITQVSSSIGPIIPPSTGMVFLSIYFGVSVRRLFIGGIVPGLLMGLIQVVLSVIISKRRNFPSQPFQGWKYVAQTVKGGFFALMLPVAVMVCLILGIGTVVEIGAMSCVMALVIALCYRELNPRVMLKSLLDVGIQLSSILVMMAASGMFKWLIDRIGVGKYLIGAMTVFSDSPMAVVATACVIFLILGCFLDTSILQFVLVPMLVPTFIALNIDLIWLCVLLVLVIQLGQNTPPVGVLIYITSSIAGCNMSETVKESIPYLIGMFILVLLMVVFPPLVTWLPNLVMGGA
jgi:tripartite ATP-independent transporter DctM subunit